MAVITKKDEKIENVVGELNEGYSFDDFINKFQELYPKDWMNRPVFARDSIT